MAFSSFAAFISPVVVVVHLLLLLLSPNSRGANLPSSDIDNIEFPLNLEYLEAEFFLWASLGRGLDSVAPNLTMGGPPPIGVRRALLDYQTRDIILQFGYQEVGHIRAIKSTVPGFPRPLLNLSAGVFAKVMDAAFGRPLIPPFDPYANGINFLLASYVIPYVGLTGYVGANPNLISATAKRLVAGLLGIEAGQDAVIRGLLYERKMLQVFPYGATVADFTDRISNLRNNLGRAGIKDEGLVVPPEQGAGGEFEATCLLGIKTPSPTNGHRRKCFGSCTAPARRVFPAASTLEAATAGSPDLSLLKCS
ncbi:hypothetical protein NMG60_11024951 [Bertholletia excelsa]